MFGRRNLYCTVESFAGVRIKDERENDRNLLVEFKFDTPLDADLADEVCPKWVGDLFNETPDGFTPKAEMSAVNLTLAPGRQVVTLRQNPDLDPFAEATGVSIKHVKAKKASKLEQWVLSWTMTFSLQDDLMLGLLKMIRNGVYMTCDLMDPKLFPATTAQQDDPGADGEKPKRKGGRPRKVKRGGDMGDGPIVGEVQPSLGSVEASGDGQPAAS